MAILEPPTNKRVWSDKFFPSRIHKYFRPETRNEEFQRHREEDATLLERCLNAGFNELDNYSKLGKLGEGTYGLVTKAMHISSNIHVAIKKIKPEEEEAGISPTTVREIALLSELQHPYVVQLIDTIFSKRNINLVFEYCEYDLRKYLDIYQEQSSNSGLPLVTVQRFLYQMCKAIEFCHLNRVYHRDMKPQNVLVTGDGDRIKLADFGLARQHAIPLNSLTREVVTL